MGKVVIKKEWANAISKLKDNNVGFEHALRSFLDEDIISIGEYLSYKDITLEKFSRAYLNGFEVEKTPKDIVEEKYHKIYNDIEKTVFLVNPSPINQSIGFLQGIEYVNNIYNLGLKLD